MSEGDAGARAGITDVAGIEVGHAHDLETLTGCTVVLCREGATVGVDVRGGAPGTRETDLCRPGTLVRQANAVLLTGGSAFGLEAASGVVRYLWERGHGYDAGVARVPIVPGAVIFDLALGRIAWPDAGMGYEACERASAGAVAQGCVGVGAGASVGKLLGPARATKSGVGTASVRAGGHTVGAIVVVNALGNVVNPRDGRILAGARDPKSGEYVNAALGLGLAHLRAEGAPDAATNTTIGVVATDASLDKEATNHLARVAHDGLARTIRPVHTLFDGDTIFALATGGGTPAPTSALLALSVATVEAVERAVVNAVRFATPAGGLPGGK